MITDTRRHSPSTIQLLQQNPEVPSWQFSLILRIATCGVLGVVAAAGTALSYGACSNSDQTLAKAMTAMVIVALLINVLDLIHGIPRWRRADVAVRRMQAWRTDHKNDSPDPQRLRIVKDDAWMLVG